MASDHLRCSSYLAISGLVLLIGGCGSGIPLRQVPPAPARMYPVAGPGQYATYSAYGDSITAGFGLTKPQAYPSLVAADRGLSLSNNALNGDQACDLTPRQIFPGWIRSASLSSVLVGTNDVDFKGAGPYEAVYTLCLQGALSWLAVP